MTIKRSFGQTDLTGLSLTSANGRDSAGQDRIREGMRQLAHDAREAVPASRALAAAVARNATMACPR